MPRREVARTWTFHLNGKGRLDTEQVQAELIQEIALQLSTMNENLANIAELLGQTPEEREERRQASLRKREQGDSDGRAYERRRRARDFVDSFLVKGNDKYAMMQRCVWATDCLKSDDTEGAWLKADNWRAWFAAGKYPTTRQRELWTKWFAAAFPDAAPLVFKDPENA